jgi:hypothetical protein
MPIRAWQHSTAIVAIMKGLDDKSIKSLRLSLRKIDTDIRRAKG